VVLLRDRRVEVDMLYSRNRQFLFVHVQQTGGSSVESALASAAPDAIRRFDDLPAAQDPLKNRHLFASDLKEYFDAEAWSNCYKFAFVRNPWSRLVSWYNTCIDRPTTPFMRLVKRQGATFNDFLMLSQGRAERVGFDQTEYITDSAGNLIVDFVGRFERIARDFRTVCDRLQVDVRLPHKHRGLAVDYREYYNSASQKLVAGRCARDIAMFGYSFDDGDLELPSDAVLRKNAAPGV
jgi:hypothetical protein